MHHLLPADTPIYSETIWIESLQLSLAQYSLSLTVDGSHNGGAWLRLITVTADKVGMNYTVYGYGTVSIPYTTPNGPVSAFNGSAAPGTGTQATHHSAATGASGYFDTDATVTQGSGTYKAVYQSHKIYDDGSGGGRGGGCHPGKPCGLGHGSRPQSRAGDIAITVIGAVGILAGGAAIVTVAPEVIGAASMAYGCISIASGIAGVFYGAPRPQ